MADDSRGPREPLSPREQQVLKLIAEAHPNRAARVVGRYAIRRGLVEP